MQIYGQDHKNETNNAPFDPNFNRGFEYNSFAPDRPGNRDPNNFRDSGFNRDRDNRFQDPYRDSRYQDTDNKAFRGNSDGWYEAFHIFESVPKYGLINNVLFTVSNFLPLYIFVLVKLSFVVSLVIS